MLVIGFSMGVAAMAIMFIAKGAPTWDEDYHAHGRIVGCGGQNKPVYQVQDMKDPGRFEM